MAAHSSAEASIRRQRVLDGKEPIQLSKIPISIYLIDEFEDIVNPVLIRIEWLNQSTRLVSQMACYAHPKFLDKRWGHRSGAGQQGMEVPATGRLAAT